MIWLISTASGGYSANYIDLYFEFDNYGILSSCHSDAYHGESGILTLIEFEGPCKPSESHK
jgi:hypothetical protein